MNWEAVERCFAACIAGSAAEREAVLAAEADAAVRDEVRRLLLRHDGFRTDPVADRFLNSLELELASRLVTEEPPDPEQIGRFPVVRRLGRGAAGVVYLAHDPELDRPLAIKLLTPGFASDQRWSEEARAASALKHPNVVTVFETGRTEDGRRFIAMAYEEGETLRQRLDREPLDTATALRIAADLANALAAAHAKGITHRDIKPENVLLTARGACLIDFGIAAAEGADTARPHGTTPYMSPEQARGDAVDHRTDLWALGVVLYEMLTGSRPFTGDTREAVLQQIRSADPAPISPPHRDVPAEVVTLVASCLRKDLQDRPDSADAVLAVLQRTNTPPTGRSRRWIPGASLLAVAALLALAGWRAFGTRDDLADAVRPGVAVMPYQAIGPDVSYLADGMVHLLSFGIEGVPGLRKIDPVSVLSAWDAASLDGDPETDSMAVSIAQHLDAAYVVTGSVVQLGDNVRMIAEVHDAQTGRVRGSAEVTGPLDSVAGLIDRLTLELLRRNLLPADRGRLPVSLSASTTRSLPALKEYLAGERQFRLANWAEARRHYTAAINYDSTFGRAIYRNIKVIDWGDRIADRTELLERLAALVDKLPDRDRLLILGDMSNRLSVDGTIDWQHQIDLLEEMVQRYPDDVEGWAILGERQFHDGGVLLLPNGIHRRALMQAIALNPYYSEPYFHLIDDALFRLDSAEASRLVGLVRQIDETTKPCSIRFEYDLVWGTPSARRETLQALDTLSLPALWTACLTRHSPYLAPPAVRDKLSDIYRRIADTARVTEQLAQPFLFLLFRPRHPRGQLAEIRSRLAEVEGDAGRDDAWPERWELMLHLTASPDSVTAHRAASYLAASSYPLVRVWGGLLAVMEHRWDDAEAIEVWAERDWAKQFPQQAVNLGPKAGPSYAALLRAFRLFAQGDGSKLVAIDTALRHVDRLSANEVNATVRFLTGRLLLERGQLADAERYFLSFGAFDFLGVQAGYHLAQIADRLGRSEEALARYQWFLRWWEGADPELQQPVVEAREAIRRLARSADTARLSRPGQ